MKCEHDDLIWTKEDEVKSKWLALAGLVFVVSWISFLFITIPAPTHNANKGTQIEAKK